ncbi:hypothetical protein HPB51_016609 [Rhipicephalus microplus]|uniref:Uncharacterized protein n=1 Tax=Rhipicephalus microplus TaxID=6941 RepID=A0A9J6EI66_RHIMP|nr:hypothetical protein HPB51_016609 [Rhipicephalus microplus]
MWPSHSASGRRLVQTQDGKLVPSSDSGRRRPRYSVSPRSKGLQDYSSFVAISDPTWQEVKMTLHWLAFDVTKDAIRRAFYEYGYVKDVTYDRWRVEDCEGVESTTRVIRMQLRDGVSVDQLPHQKQTTLEDALVLNKSKQVSSAPDANAGRKMGNPAVPTTSEQTRSAPAMHAASQLQATRPETPASQANAASTPLKSASQCSLANETHHNEDLPVDLDTLRMELESASEKHRRDSDDGAQVDETQVKSEVQWKVVSGGKKRNAARQRSLSLKRNDGRLN